MMLTHISILLALLTNLVLGALVVWTNPRRRPNQFFFLLALVIAAWLISFWMIVLARTPEQADLAIRAASAVAIFVPIGFNLLRLAVQQADWSFGRVVYSTRGWLLTTSVVSALCFADLFLRGVVIPEAGPGVRLVPEPVYGPGALLYNLVFLASFVHMVTSLIRGTRRSAGVPRVELQFILTGATACVIVGTAFALLLPLLTGSAQVAQFAPLCVIILGVVIAYGIATRRIMDIADVLRRMTAYALLSAYLVGLYLVVWQMTAFVLRPYFGPAETIAHLVAALALAFSMAPANGWMQRFANRMFVNVQSIDITDTLQKANRILNSIATRDDLLDQFAALVAQAFGTDRVIILLAEERSIRQRYPRESPSSTLRMDPNDPLIRVLRTTAEPLVVDAVSRVRASPEELQAARVMATLRTSIAVGINPAAGLRGVILLGPRLSGRVYGSAEQQVLQVLGNQLAVGLENAELYTRLQDSAIYNDILLDSLVSGVIAVNADRMVTVFNREAQRITHLPPHEVQHQSLERLPVPLQQALRQTLENGRGVRDAEAKLRVHEHEEIPIRFGTSLFHSHTGKALGALLVFDDLTALRKLESQVRRTDRLASLGTLSAGMAHEIKNPLVTLKTFTQLLPERYEDQDFRETFSSLVGQEVKRIDSIVNQLLRFARPAKPSLVPMHLHEVIENTLRLVHQQLRQKGITLKKDLTVSNDMIQGDADLLVQAFLNFLLNAVDAMESGGELTVTTRLVEQESAQTTFLGVPSTESLLKVSIRDTGRGIRPEDIAHVFDPFFTTKTSGTGLGLSVSHGIIHEHRGAIDVESELGKGTTFHLVFPLAPREVPA